MTKLNTLVLSIAFLFSFCVSIKEKESQKQLTPISCDKAYHPLDSTQSIDNVFGKNDIFFQNCSWFCNTSIIVESKQDDFLNDHKTITAFTLDKPIKQNLEFGLYLQKDSLNYDTTTFVSGLLLANGNRTNRKNYHHFSRLKKAKIFVNEKQVGIANFLDQPSIQLIQFSQLFQLKNSEKIHIRIQIEEIYKGKSSVLAISELQLDGLGGHSLVGKLCR